MLHHGCARIAYPGLLIALITLTALSTPAAGQGFQPVILPQGGGDHHAVATSISRAGVVAGYGWDEDESSPRRGLRWTPAANYGTVEAPQMNGSLTTVVFSGIDPITDWPFGAAVGPDTGGAIHAIQVDDIEVDPFISDLSYGDWTDTHASGFAHSEMLGGIQGFRVGIGVPGASYLPHAVLWDGATSTIVDLHPWGFAYSRAVAMASFPTGEGVVRDIAGWAEQQGRDRARLWSVIDSNFAFVSKIDLHPAGYDSSRAHGVSSRWIVGSGSPANTGTLHALSFTASGSVTDLSPSGSSYSEALGASESGIVGYSGSSTYGRRALFWSDADPGQVVDLHQFLPADYISSHAVALNDAKQIVGTAIRSDGEHYAVIWRPVSRLWAYFPIAVAAHAQLVNAYIVLDKPAPKGGLRVGLSPTTAEETYAWSLLKEVVVPEGKTSAAFTVATTERRPGKPVRATITATWGRDVRQATLTIDPSATSKR